MKSWRINSNIIGDKTPKAKFSVALALCLLVVFCLLSSGGLYAQSKEKLKKQKNKIHNQIKEMNGLLSEISINKKKSELAYLINQKKIGAREDLIKSINQEINLLDHELSTQEKAIDSLNNLLQEYREQYEKMLVYAYKNRNANNSIIFIFSASDFNDAYKRMKYLKKIGDYRKYQAEELNKAQMLVEQKIEKLEEKKAQKNKYLGNKHYERNKLKTERKENQEVLKNLKMDEKKLKKKIQKKQREAQKLDDEIRKIIQKEIEIARKKAEEARKKNKGKSRDPKDAFDLTPVASRLSKNFEKNKGKLPWPVKSGTVSGKFGINTHAVFEHLKVNNNGIDILTNQGSNAKAVFGGNVVAVIVLPNGGKSAVLLQHGAYFTMYSNLVTVKVEKGEKVKIGQALGKIKTDDEGKTEVHFEIWRGSEKQNPSYWLKRK